MAQPSQAAPLLRLASAGGSGAFQQDRHHCTLVDGGEHAFNCIRCIDLNVVRVGVVDHPREWRWCGHDELRRRESCPGRGIRPILGLKLHCSYRRRVKRHRFSWDPRKAEANEKKHGVSFEEAQTVFLDDYAMRKQCDFSKAKRNPYSKRLKRQITIRLDVPTIDYFKDLAEETGIPYQTLINLYLRDCAANRRQLSMRWRSA